MTVKIKGLLTGVLLFLCAMAAGAQTTQITASHIQYFGGATVTGTFCLTPTDQLGNPINIVTSMGQQVSPQTPLCFKVTSGVLSNLAIVPDVSQTQPANACYKLVINNAFGSAVATFPCIQPEGSTWSFDAYVPSSLPGTTALTLPQFKTNGTTNSAQGTLNLSCSGCTESGGTVTIPAGGSGSLPSAPGYGYSLVSSGAGTTYTPQIDILAFGSNGVQYVQQPLGNGFYPSLNINFFGKMFYADGFASYGGVGSAVTAYSSSTDAAVCQVVSYSGSYYLAVNNVNKTTTPGTNAGVWYPVRNNLPATYGDCANHMADAFTRGQNVGSTVLYGAGNYTLNQGLVEQTTGSSFGDEFSVSLSGAGQGVTNLVYAGTAGVPMISRPNGGANFSSISIHDMTLDGGGLASSIMDLDTLNQSYFYNLSMGHVAPGSDHVAQFAHTGGFGFQVFAKNINIGVYPDTNYPNCAVVTPTVSSGSVTSWTVNTPGTCYRAASASNVYHVQLRTRNGSAADGGCTTYPSGQTVTLSGTGIGSITGGTGGTGCGTGPFYVQVYSTTPVNYGIVFNNSDSSAEDITSYLGDLAAFSINAGNFVGTHLHPSVVPNGIINNGSGHLIGTEIDDVFDKAFTFNQPFTTTGMAVTGTNGYVGCGGTSRLNVGSTMFYFGSATTNVNIAANGSLFDGGGTNSSCNAGWEELVTQSGPIHTAADYLAKAPAGFSLTGNDGSLALTKAIGDFIPILTTNTFTTLAVKGNTVNALASGTATSGANFGSAGSPGFGPQASYWNGSASATSTAIEQLNAGSGTNPTLQAVHAIYPCPATCSHLYQQPVIIQANLDVLHIQGYGSPGPSFAAGTGAGTSPTLTAGYNTDLSGYETVTTGTTPTASATIFTITFGTAYAYPGPKCVAWPANPATQALVGAAAAQFFPASITTTSAALTQGSTALAAATAYEWGYFCSN